MDECPGKDFFKSPGPLPIFLNPFHPDGLPCRAISSPPGGLYEVPGTPLIRNQVVIMITERKVAEGFKKLFYLTKNVKEKEEKAAEEMDR
jgi:hypothetical protein